jgi:hypothetical protein
MSTRRLAGLCVFLLFRASYGRAALEANPTYTELRAARPKGEAVSVQGLTLERDAFRFQFESGSFQFLTLSDGRAVAAVFAGDGRMELNPATATERRQLALVTGEKGLEVLSDRFDSAILLFTDGTAAQIRQKAAPTAASPRAPEIYEAFLRKQRKELKANLQLRLLRDLLAPAGSTEGVFMVYAPGKKYPAGLAVLDPAGLDWLAPGLLVGGEEVAYDAIGEPETGLWYLCHRKDEGRVAASHAPGRHARALHYGIETTIKANAEIRGTTVVQVRPLSSGERVVGLNLLGKLRLIEAGWAESDAGPWQPVEVIQEASEEDADAAVVLPRPLTSGQSFYLRLAYEGKDVLHSAGDGNFIVDARESWYPNLGTFSELASFDLTYRCPKAYEVVSVGHRTENRVEGDARVSVWKAERPIRVAGFNYGKFKRREQTDKESGFQVEAYTNTGTPDVINEINSYLRGREGGAHEIGSNPVLPGDLDSPFYNPAPGAGLHSVQVDVDTLADSAIADGINTARICSVYYGPLPEKRVAITEQSQPFFGQSWPALIYLPFIAALDGTTRRELGLKNAADFVEQVGPHEFAHQWWGHLVGWASYRDQWLSEGFAEFSAALWLQRTGGGKKFNDYWEKERKWILGKPQQSAVFNCEAGPITQGIRLATRRSPSAYQAMIYDKGAYVLHMLRMMMRERGADADAKFMALMKDFATTYAGANPSTSDFQKVVERHMTPAMNVTGDGKMDWFFRQWVYGLEIPRFRQKLDVAPVSGDQYKIVGSVSQEAVSPDFWTLIQVYVEFPKGEIAHLGTLSLKGNTTTPVDVTVKLPKAPRRVVLNAFHDVLTLD